MKIGTPIAAENRARVRKDSEEAKWPLLLEEMENGPADSNPVAIGAQPANRTLGAGLVRRIYFRYRHIELKRVNCKFRLDIEALRERLGSF